MRLGLTYPDRFKAVCSLSAPLDLKTAVETLRDNIRDCRRRAFCSVYGSCEQFGGSSADILHLIERTPPATAPFLWLYVGRNDPLLQINKQTAEKSEKKALPFRLKRTTAPTTGQAGTGRRKDFSTCTWEIIFRNITRLKRTRKRPFCRMRLMSNLGENAPNRLTNRPETLIIIV